MSNLMILRVLLVFSLIFTALGVKAANTLDVEFDGVLIDITCQLTTASLKQDVTLENLRWQSLNQNVFSGITPFSLAIEKCSEANLKKTIKLTWQSSQLVDIGGKSYLPTQGSSGVLLGLVDKDENPITWNKPIELGLVTVVGDTQQFDFGVLARKPANADAKVGDFSGAVTFSVEYE